MLSQKKIYVLIVLLFFIYGATYADEKITKNTTPDALPYLTSMPKPLTIDQILANTPKSTPEKFEFLRKQRKITTDAITQATRALKILDDSFNEKTLRLKLHQESISTSLLPDQLKKEIQQLEGQLHDKKSNTTSKQSILLDSTGRIESLILIKTSELRAHEAIAEINHTLEEIQQEKQKTIENLLSYQSTLSSLDDTINQIIIESNSENSFKFQMSAAFSALVGVVIIGFFSIAWSNEEIKKTIFANEAGIQFITIFSIVIAVILFGIIGVLESKELSALLGGLSGYILGKSRST